MVCAQRNILYTQESRKHRHIVADVGKIYVFRGAAEAERIRKCNGRVLALKPEPEPHIQRVWLPNDDSPGLAMSRAFGDFVLMNNGITCTPEVTYHHLTPDDTFLVLATDGVWDVLSNEKVMSIVAAAHNEEGAAQAVVDAALASWKQNLR